MVGEKKANIKVLGTKQYLEKCFSSKENNGTTVEEKLNKEEKPPQNPNPT